MRMGRAAAFVDGWLRTGDQASIDAGRIRILSRIKEIIVTSTGEKIAPADLEQAVPSDPLFEQAYAFGDNRQFIACALVLSRSGWVSMAVILSIAPWTSENTLLTPTLKLKRQNLANYFAADVERLYHR